MWRVLGRIQKGLIVSLLVLVIGGHWALLQGAAWAGMLLSYSRGTTITEAWSKTFDGKHPCKLCKTVRAGKAAEKKQEMVKVELNFEFSFARGTAWLFPPRPCRQFLPVDSSSLARLEAPMTPPPRSA